MKKVHKMAGIARTFNSKERKALKKVYKSLTLWHERELQSVKELGNKFQNGDQIMKYLVTIEFSPTMELNNLVTADSQERAVEIAQDQFEEVVNKIGIDSFIHEYKYRIKEVE